MKETRISMLLLLSMSLLLLAFVILFIWGFIYYRKTADAVPAAIEIKNDISPAAKYTRDSIQQIYTATLQNLNAALDSTRVNSDAVQQDMDAKMKEFYVLKAEIDVLLANSQSAPAMAEARKKMQQLQLRLEDWRNKYTNITEENKRLNFLLAQMVDTKKSSAASVDKPVNENTIITRPANLTTALSVSDLQLKAMMEDRKQETFQALQTDLLQGSFNVKGNAASAGYDEIYIVLQQPDGRVLTQSAWDSGSFETRNGRKMYSYKWKFDNEQGENKRLNFIIEADRYQKGIYTMEIYYKAVLLARTTKSLS